MFTTTHTPTARVRRSVLGISAVVLIVSALTGCGAESSADIPASEPETSGSELAEDAGHYVGDPWEQRLKNANPGAGEDYVGDPWEQRYRNR